MKKTYINPFALLQSNQTEKLLFLTNDEESLFLIDDSNHPLFKAHNIKDIEKYLPALDPKDIQELMDANIISTIDFDRNNLLQESYQKAEREDALYLTIFPTLNCNNACSYCYQEHEGQPVMSREDYKTISKFLTQKISKGIKNVFYSIMGGEGTLEYMAISEHLSQVKQLCRQYGANLNCSMTTNGRLLANDYITRTLLNAGITSYQVTVDGPPHIHNKTRPAINGSDSYQETIRGLLKLKELADDNLLCTIRTNHTPETITRRNLELHLNNMARYFKGDKRFVFYNAIASNLGGDIDTSKLIAPEKKRATSLQINRLTAEKGLAIKSDIYAPGGRVCYAAKKNSLTIMPGLKIKKCTVALNESINDIGRILEDGTLQQNENAIKWTQSANKSATKCKKCRVAPICHGKTCPHKLLTKGVLVCPDVKTDNQFMLRSI